jgi:hypothetical protein
MSKVIDIPALVALLAPAAPVTEDGTPTLPAPVDERIDSAAVETFMAITGSTPAEAAARRLARQQRNIEITNQLAQIVKDRAERGVLIDQMQVQITALADAATSGQANFATIFSLLNAERQERLAAEHLQATRDALQDQKDELQDAAITQLQLADQATAATDAAQSALIEQNRLADAALALRQTATEKKVGADELDIAALKASDTNQAAQLTAQASGIEADRLLAVAAQAKADQASADAKTAKDLATAAQARADQAEADAQAAKTAAAAAQTTANTATTNLAAANARIDTAVANIATLQTSVATAQSTATAAQTAVTALADKGQVMLGIATPASVGLLGAGGTITVPITFPKPFADANYGEAFTRVSGMAAVVGFSVTNKTATGLTLVLTNNGAISLTIPAGVVDAVFTHK